MKHYSDTEREDAQTVAQIDQVIHTKVADWEQHYATLVDMFGRIPTDYKNQFEQDGIQYIKFWEQDEYDWYMELIKPDKPIEPLANAYPRCCYLLAIILIEQGKANEAYRILSKGLELEPDQPWLLSEMGMLGGQAAQTEHNSKVWKTAFSWYAHAFESRPYNTPAQKARALRGMGFACIELEDWDMAEKYYEASLTWQDSENAKNELELIREKKEDPATTVSIKGSGFDKGERPDSYTTFWHRAEKLPKTLRDELPDVYVYIWAKAARLGAIGPVNYRNDDHFKYPAADWKLDEVMAGSFQITNYLKGFHPAHALEALSDEGMEQLIRTFHFAKEAETLVRNSADQLIKKVSFKHLMDGETIDLYYVAPAKEAKPWWKIW
ncbi:tetratricopeptide repeat protein [Spirosoma sp.]|uniref:tetratricopeptide repeat protein n=1 Tax=Spirosoma sp. TaxID=1899569 RepID=UPI003B3B2F4D